MDQDGSAAGPGRRRVRVDQPRRRQVVVRFSDAELALVGERAALAGLAVRAWIGAIAVEVACAGGPPSVTLPDLLCLHADVLAVERVALSVGVGHDEVAALLARLDAAVDEIIRQRASG